MMCAMVSRLSALPGCAFFASANLCMSPGIVRCRAQFLSFPFQCSLHTFDNVFIVPLRLNLTCVMYNLLPTRAFEGADVHVPSPESS